MVTFITCPPSMTTSSNSGSTGTCTRRSFLSFSLLATFLPRQILAKDIFGVGDAVPSEQFESVRARVKGQLSLQEFISKLENGNIKQVWFFGAFNDFCCFETDTGEILQIGEGYPKENPRNPESPLRIMAKVRDRKVPYYMAPLSGKYYRRTN